MPSRGDLAGEIASIVEDILRAFEEASRASLNAVASATCRLMADRAVDMLVSYARLLASTRGLTLGEAAAVVKGCIRECAPACARGSVVEAKCCLVVCVRECIDRWE
jgi:hypothetical protein